MQRHLLIVENDPDDALFLRRAFSTMNESVSSFVCRNVSEARAYLRGAGMYSDRAKYPTAHAVISDFTMDGETGADLVRWLKNDPELKDIPVVIVSGSFSPSDSREAERLGIRAFYRKPHQFEELKHLVRRICTDLA